MSDATSNTAAKEPATKATNLPYQRRISFRRLFGFVEQGIPHHKRCALFGELVDIFLGHWVTSVRPPLEQMRQFVKLPELPLGVGRVLSSTNG